MCTIVHMPYSVKFGLQAIYSEANSNHYARCAKQALIRIYDSLGYTVYHNFGIGINTGHALIVEMLIQESIQGLYPESLFF